MASNNDVVAYVLGNALYLNLTNGCTLACSFCPKVRRGELKIGAYDLRLSTNPTVDEAWNAAVAVGIEERVEVVFTGFGESTTRFGVLLELIRRLKEADVERVRLDTEGLASLREGRDVVPELALAGLDAVSVSLNAPDPMTYARICPSKYGANAWGAACEFIRSAVCHVRDVSVSFVGVPDVNETECQRLALGLGAKFRWRPFQTERSTSLT
jgi:TatD DNase family protein